MKFMTFLSFLLVITLSTAAFSAPKCSKLFDTRSRLQKAATLFIKDAPTHVLETKRLGFATKISSNHDKSKIFKAIEYTFDFIPNQLGHLITLDRSFTFTPFKAIDEWTLDKPAHFVSQKISGKKKELGFLSKLPIWVMMSVATWNVIDQKIFWPAAEKEASERILEITNTQSAYFDKLIDTDFKFRQIKQQRDETLPLAKPLEYNGKNLESYIETPVVRSRFLAYGLKQEYSKYFETYREQTQRNGVLSLKQNQEVFGTNPLFAHLDFFFGPEAKHAPGSYVAPQHRGPITDKQKEKLYNLTHLLYAKYITLEIMLNTKTDIQTLIKKSALARDIYNDPYTQELYKLRNQGRITQEELKYFLEEDAYFKYYMSIFETLHITNFKEVNGNYTNEPLTLNDLRTSRLESLK